MINDFIVDVRSSIFNSWFLKDHTALLLTLFAIFVIHNAAIIIYNIFFHPLRHYPGPLLGRATAIYYIHYKVSGLQHVKEKEWHDTYGEVVRISPNYLSYNSAKAWMDIAGHRSGANQGTFDKDQAFFGKPLNGANHIAAANGEEHRRLRRLLSHAFSEKSLKLQEPLLKSYVDKFIHEISQRACRGESIDMSRWLNFATFDVIGDLAFGEPFGLLTSGEWSRYVDSIFGSVKIGIFIQAVTQLFVSPFTEIFMLLFVPKKLIEDLKYQARLAEEKLKSRMQITEPRNDFFSHILKRSQAVVGEEGLTLNEMVSQAQVLILAGSETTATLLCGLTYHLLKNPTTLDTLKTEIRSSFEDESELILNRLASLPYMNAVIEEALRMYPPVPNALPRVTPYPGAVICGKYVPGGTSVGLHHYSTYRCESNFSEPDSFIPERWLADTNGRFSGDDKTAFHPFSYGPRNCLGRNLAYGEMRLIVAKLIWNFDMELQQESQNWTNQLTYNLWSKGELRVKLTPAERLGA